MKQTVTFRVNVKRGDRADMPIGSGEVVRREDIGYVERYVEDT